MCTSIFIADKLYQLRAPLIISQPYLDLAIGIDSSMFSRIKKGNSPRKWIQMVCYTTILNNYTRYLYKLFSIYRHQCNTKQRSYYRTICTLFKVNSKINQQKNEAV